MNVEFLILNEGGSKRRDKRGLPVIDSLAVGPLACPAFAGVEGGGILGNLVLQICRSYGARSRLERGTRPILAPPISGREGRADVAKSRLIKVNPT
jgi:hypothetical protein